MPAQNDRKDEFVRIELTDAQKDQIKEKTGKSIDSVELTVEELEERIAPHGFDMM